MGCRAPQMRQPERGLGQPSRQSPWPWPWPSRMSGRRTRHSSPVRVRCPPGGRLSIGRADVRCPRDRRDPGVRTDTPPVSAASASALSTPRWILECVGAAGPPTSGRIGFDVSLCPRAVGSSLPNRPGGEGMVVGWPCVARTGSTADGRCSACVQTAAPRSQPGRPRELVQRQGAGRLAWSTRKEQVLAVPRVCPGQVAA
jgi:hypothetical protein